MTTLASVMLEVAKLVTPVFEGVATGGSTTTLIDTGLSMPAGHYNNGTVWMTSGTNSGDVIVIKTHGNNTLTLNETLTAAIVATDKYAVCDQTFSKPKLKQAVKMVLSGLEIPTKNTSHTASSGSITLSSISNVKRVLLDDVENYHWKEVGGKILFDDPDAESTDVDIYYMAAHSDLDDGGTVDAQVNLEWLKWAAAVNLWRSYLQEHHNDDPMATGFLNEALKKETELSNTAKESMGELKRAPRLARW